MSFESDVALFASGVNSELPKRIIIVRGAYAIGDPTTRAEPYVASLIEGSMYFQSDVDPKQLWIKNGPLQADWQKNVDPQLFQDLQDQIDLLAVTDEITLETYDDAGTNKSRIKDGGVSYIKLDSDLQQRIDKTDDFSKEIISWDPDLGGVPIQVDVPPFVADAFSFALDTAVYADVYLGPLYDQSNALIFKYMFQLPGPDVGQVKVELGFQFIGGDTAPGLNYTIIQDYFIPDGSANIRSREISIPAQVGLGSNPLLSLQFVRLGTTDTSTEDLNLIHTQIYQS